MRKQEERTDTENRLRKVIERYGVKSKSDLSRRLETSTAQLNNWCYRDKVPHKYAQKMAEIFDGLNPNFVEFGEGRICLNDTEENTSIEEKTSIEDKTVAPSLNSIVVDMPHRLTRYPIDLITAKEVKAEAVTMMAEDFVVTCGDVDLGQVSEHLVPIHLPGGCAKYMFGCKGVSMEPKLYEGDYIGVNETMSKYESFDPNRMYLIFTKTGKAMVKYVEDPGPDYDYLQLRTLNKDYKLDDDGRLPKEEFRAACKIVVIVNWL